MTNVDFKPTKIISAMFCLLSMMIVILFSPTSALAHQSGCHRWHSCPSDSGSYVCGDTGYTSECGDSSTYFNPVVDYAAQGRSNGEIHATTKDLPYIESNAQMSGSTDGSTDGDSGATEFARPDSSATCGRAFTFDTPQESLYVSSFESAYKNKCIVLFSKAYSSAYSTAYTSSAIVRKTAEAEKKKAD